MPCWVCSLSYYGCLVLYAQLCGRWLHNCAAWVLSYWFARFRARDSYYMHRYALCLSEVSVVFTPAAFHGWSVGDIISPVSISDCFTYGCFDIKRFTWVFHRSWYVFNEVVLFTFVSERGLADASVQQRLSSPIMVIMYSHNNVQWPSQWCLSRLK